MSWSGKRIPKPKVNSWICIIFLYTRWLYTTDIGCTYIVQYSVHYNSTLYNRIAMTILDPGLFTGLVFRTGSSTHFHKTNTDPNSCAGIAIKSAKLRSETPEFRWVCSFAHSSPQLRNYDLSNFAMALFLKNGSLLENWRVCFLISSRTQERGQFSGVDLGLLASVHWG